MNSEIAEILDGAVDLHIHTAPDISPRSVTAVEAASQAKDLGLRAIGLKSHSTDTSARAQEAAEATGMEVYGGVVLNYAVGGLNPAAVLESARQGGRIVWMPTSSARHFLSEPEEAANIHPHSPIDSPGLSLVEEGSLLPEVFEIIDIAIQHDLILCSGHISPMESAALFEEATARGSERNLVTHPHAPFVGMSAQEMISLADKGVFHEFVYAMATPALEPPQSIRELADLIRIVGAESCILSSDGGQALNPPPSDMYRSFIKSLKDEGLSDDHLKMMASANPGRLLDE